MLAAGRPGVQRDVGDIIEAVFRDRLDAGEQLALALRALVDGPAVVLGIPRGGVIVGAPVARLLGCPLDVVVTHKLGAPDNPELAIGAVAPGVRVIDARIVAGLRVPPAYLEEEVARQEREIERRMSAYRGERAARDLAGTTAVVVDDGVATGATAVAALRWARGAGAERVVFAAPVGPEGIDARLGPECDACVILHTPADLRAVGQWYERFAQVSDDDVRSALAAGDP
jgi:putative phosphoribosyl transferase